MSFVPTLHPMSQELLDDIILTRVMQIYDVERTINLEEPVHLLTWSPDPKQLPSSDFYL